MTDVGNRFVTVKVATPVILQNDEDVCAAVKETLENDGESTMLASLWLTRL